jgi:hypothetical protein
MTRTYRGILKGNQVEWTDEAPNFAHPVPVDVTLVDASADATTSGKEMARLLEEISKRDPFAAIVDPVEWQREMRKDRPLPGREP